MNIVVGAGADELLEWARVCACCAVYVYGCRPRPGSIASLSTTYFSDPDPTELGGGQISASRF